MKRSVKKSCLVAFFLFVTHCLCTAEENGQKKLVDIQTLNNDILVYLAYSTTNNFMGEDVYGDLETCYLRKEVALKLSLAQTILTNKKKGYHLLVYDGLRPKSVQYKMWELVKGTSKQKYVANPETGSIHNYGAAVDLTIADENGMPLDMGTPYDYFGDLAQPRYEEKFLKQGLLTTTQINHRKLLRKIMAEAGFLNINIEWWHFNAFTVQEVKQKFDSVEFILTGKKTEPILKDTEI